MQKSNIPLSIGIFYHKNIAKSVSLNVFIVTFATLIKTKYRNEGIMKGFYQHTVTSTWTMTPRG